LVATTLITDCRDHWGCDVIKRPASAWSVAGAQFASRLRVPAATACRDRLRSPVAAVTRDTRCLGLIAPSGTSTTMALTRLPSL